MRQSRSKLQVSVLLLVLVMFTGCTANTTVHFRNDTAEHQNVSLRVPSGHEYQVGTIPPGGSGFCKLNWGADVVFPATCRVRAGQLQKLVKLHNYANGINVVDAYFVIQRGRLIGPAYSPLPVQAADYLEGGDVPTSRKTNGAGPQTPLTDPSAR